MRYEFVVAGRISETALAAFPELQPAPAQPAATSLFGPVRDQAALRGVLARFDDLGLTVLEMRQLPDAADSPTRDHPSPG